MNFLHHWRHSARRATAGLMAGSAALVLLAGCGGGTSQVEAFVPERVVLMGDETSVIVDDGNADGFKYSVNKRESADPGNCLQLPTFSQMLLSLYGYVVPECNPNSVAAKGLIVAQVGGRVADAATGLAAQRALVPAGLGNTDLVSLMIGANDIVAVYEQVAAGAIDSAAAIAEASRLGGVAADQVNGILAAGARAIVVTIPDMSLSPWGIAQQAARSDAAAVISSMSYEFNSRLRTGIDATRFDGRNYGLVLADDIVGAMAKVPTAFLSSPSVGDAPACATASAVDCTTTTLVTDASADSHLWADDRHLAYQAHYRIGLSAQARAAGNPF